MDHKSITLNEKSQMQVKYCDSTYTTFWKRQNYRNKNQVSGCQELVWGKGLNKSEPERTFRVMEVFCFLIIMVITKLYVCIKIHQAIHFNKRVGFIVCKLYLNKSY